LFGLSLPLPSTKIIGKTALMAYLCKASIVPFVRFISADDLVASSEHQRVSAIKQAFFDAYRSPVSIILLDDLERLMDYVRIGEERREERGRKP